MAYCIKYYDDLDLGFVYKKIEIGKNPLATFYRDETGGAWKFVQPPSNATKTFQHSDIEEAVRAFLIHIGVPFGDGPLPVERC